MDKALWRGFEERFNKPVSNSWGQSETVCDALYAGPATETRRYGTIGRPVGCEARVVDEANRPVPDGDIGELQIRGPIVMAGYVNNPEATSQVMAGDWLRTGDLVHRSNDGFFRFVGRKRNMIVSRGVSIHPESVTAALRTSDAVVEAVAIGMPHDDWGERIVAFVVLAASHSTTIAELHDLCREQLAPEKRPERIIVLPELPRGPAGKVRLDALRRKFSEIEAIRGDHAASLSIYEIAGQVFGMRAADLSPQSTPYNTPNWDSFAHIELIVAVETAFNIVMTAEDILGITSLADVENMA